MAVRQTQARDSQTGERPCRSRVGPVYRFRDSGWRRCPSAWWASKFNLKQAQTLSYLNQHQLLDYQVLYEKTAAATDRYH